MGSGKLNLKEEHTREAFTRPMIAERRDRARDGLCLDFLFLLPPPQRLDILQTRDNTDAFFGGCV